MTHRDRPKSAWGDAATSCDIVQNESEILTDEAAYKQHFLESLILTSNGLNVQGDYGGCGESSYRSPDHSYYIVV